MVSKETVWGACWDVCVHAHLGGYRDEELNVSAYGVF